MPEVKEFPVYGEGIRGVVIGPARYLDERKEKLVRLEDGSEFTVPAEALEAQPDGSFYLRQPPVETQEKQSTAVEPEQLFRHGYTVQHVPVDRIIEQPPEPRQEGDTMIYPVVEEVLVVEKRFLLREEIHVSRERAPIDTRRIDSEATSRPT